MDEQHEHDEAFARLRASDPAAAAQLDHDALHRDVERRIADQPAQSRSSWTSLSSRWWQVAAAVAAVAVVGGAGFWAGRGTESTTAAVPAITLDQSGTEGAFAAQDQKASADLRMWSPGRVVFSAAEGLGDEAGTAHAWGLDAASVFSADSVARLAAALGVTGDPVQQDGSWLVGPQDGSGPSVSLYSDGTASVNYYDPARDPWNCASTGTADDAQATIDPVAPCEPTGPQPSADDATAALREVMTAIGLDPAQFQFSTPDVGQPASTSVTAERVIDGQGTGLTWNATVVADGVQSLYGQLAPVVDLGEYPVVGATTAVQRMADPRFGAGSTGFMPLARDGVAVADGAATPETEPVAPQSPAPEATTPQSPAAEPTAPETTDPEPTTPDPGSTDAPAATTPPTATPGSPIAWPVQQVTITEAQRGLTQLFQADGAVILAPAYLLTGDDGSTWSVLAVADSGLAFD
jgi:hypothetical protein